MSDMEMSFTLMKYTIPMKHNNVIVLNYTLKNVYDDKFDTYFTIIFLKVFK